MLPVESRGIVVCFNLVIFGLASCDDEYTRGWCVLGADIARAEAVEVPLDIFEGVEADMTRASSVCRSAEPVECCGGR